MFLNLSILFLSLIFQAGSNSLFDQDYGYILQFADQHIQTNYVEGSEAACTKSVCCYEKVTHPKAPAGKYAYFNRSDDRNACDSPRVTFDETLDYIVNFESIFDITLSAVIFSGDVPDHACSKQSMKGNLDIIKYLYDSVDKKLPKSIQFLPVIGNHDTYPIEHCDFPGKSTEWLYENFTQIFSKFLPESEMDDVRHLISYTHLLEPGLRVITLNNFLGMAHNPFWDKASTTEKHMLAKWLREKLESSRQNGEKVIISQHIPLEAKRRNWWVSDEWIADLTAIYEDFGDMIVADLSGHFHLDYFKIVNGKDGKAVGVQYVLNSIPPWDLKVQPAVRLFKYDRSTFKLVDIIQIYNDLEASNKAKSMGPNWKVLYSMVSEYGLVDLSPASFVDLVQRMETDQPLYLKFLKNYHVDYLRGDYCEGKCKKELLCKLKCSTVESYQKCIQ